MVIGLGRAPHIYVALYGFRIGLFRRLPGDLERDTGPAYAADERHECDQRDNRDRRDLTNFDELVSDHPVGRYRDIDRLDQYRWGFFGHATHASHVSTIRYRHGVWNSYCSVHSGNNFIHS